MRKPTICLMADGQEQSMDKKQQMITIFVNSNLRLPSAVKSMKRKASAGQRSLDANKRKLSACMKQRDIKDSPLRKLLMKRDVKPNRHKSRKDKQKHSQSKNDRKLKTRREDLLNKQP